MKKLFSFLFLFAWVTAAQSSTVAKVSQLPLISGASTTANDAISFMSASDSKTKRLKIHDLINIPSFVSHYAPIASPDFIGDITGSGDADFVGDISGSNLSGTNTGDVTLGTANGLSLVNQALSLTAASTSTTGALTSTDWNTFNGKQAAGNYITALTGEVSASGPGSASATLSNAAVIAKVLTGYTSGSGTVAATDTILQAVQKLNGNTALKANTASPTFIGQVTIAAGNGNQLILDNAGEQFTLLDFRNNNSGRAQIYYDNTNSYFESYIANSSYSFTWNVAGTVKSTLSNSALTLASGMNLTVPGTLSVGSSAQFTVDSSGNVGIGTTTFGTSATNVLALANGGVVGDVADAVQLYSSDISSGNTTLGIYTEGSPVFTATAESSTNKIAIKINGTTYYLLATSIGP